VQLCRTILLVGCLGLPLLASRTVGAQAPRGPEDVTVDELVARALADNPELQAVRAEVEAAQGRVRQAELRPNPMLDLGVQDNVTGTDSNITVSVTLPLDLGGRKAGRVGVAERTFEMKRAQVLDRARRLRAEVRMKAGEVLAAQRNLQFTEELLRVNRDALDLLRARVDRGATPPLEESLLRVEVNRLEASRQLLASQVQVLTLQLKALVGLAPEAALALLGDLGAAPPPFDLQEGLTRALATRSDVMVAQAEVAMAGAMILKEQAEGHSEFAKAMGAFSKAIAEVFGATDMAKTQVNFEKAMAQAENLEERMDAFLEMTAESMFGYEGSTEVELVTDADIEKMLEEEVTHEERAGEEGMDEEIERDIEHIEKEIERNKK